MADREVTVTRDDFGEIAPYYDPIMEHVNYDRWYLVTTTLAELLPHRFQHVDLACGTCTLADMLRQWGWKTIGADLSLAMLQQGKKRACAPPTALADIRALPFINTFDLATCLFDSINFLLEPDDIRAAFRQVFLSLRDEGIFYFDIVTERMIMRHFAGQQWTEDNGEFSTTWDSRYSRHDELAETSIRVDDGAKCTIRERVYDLDFLEASLRNAGFSILGVFDAETWGAVRRRTVRVDMVAAREPSLAMRRKFNDVQRRVREFLV